MSCLTSFNAKFTVLIAKHKSSHVPLLALSISGVPKPCHDRRIRLRHAVRLNGPVIVDNLNYASIPAAVGHNWP